MRTRSLAPVLGLVRLALGARGLADPVGFAAQSQVPESIEQSPYGRYITRHNGVRELLIGAMVLAPPTRSAGLRLGVACDLLDVAVGLAASTDGASRSRSRMLMGSAAGMAGLGALAAYRSPT